MSQKSFNAYAGFIFLLVAVMHLLRIFYGWEANIGGFQVPMWASWAAVVVAGCLAYHGLLKKR